MGLTGLTGPTGRTCLGPSPPAGRPSTGANTGAVATIVAVERVLWIDADHILPLAKLEKPGPATMDLDHLCWVDQADNLRGQIDQVSIRLVVPARFVERGL